MIIFQNQNQSKSTHFIIISSWTIIMNLVFWKSHIWLKKLKNDVRDSWLDESDYIHLVSCLHFILQKFMSDCNQLLDDSTHRHSGTRNPGRFTTFPEAHHWKAGKLLFAHLGSLFLFHMQFIFTFRFVNREPTAASRRPLLTTGGPAHHHGVPSAVPTLSSLRPDSRPLCQHSSAAGSRRVTAN